MEKTAANLPEGFPFWDHLESEQRDFLSAHAHLRRFDAGKLIQGAEDACLGAIQVRKGVLRVFLLSEEGREITLFRLKKGDFCMLSASCMIDQITFDTHISVERDCELLVLGAPAFDRVVKENVYARCFMYELMAERFSAVMWVMQQILFARMDRRLASFLLAEYDRTGDPEIRMTHEGIAGQINSAREVVARMLKQFASEGWVEVRRGRVLLLDPGALRSLL